MPEGTPTPDEPLDPQGGTPEPEPATDPANEVEKWKAMARKNEQRAKDNAAAAKERDDLKKRLDDIEAASLSDKEKAEKRAEAAEAALKAAQDAQHSAEVAAMRARIGAEKSLPPTLIDRLKGDDEESITADADALLASIPKPEQGHKWPDLGQGKGGKPDDLGLATFAAAAGIKTANQKE